MDARPHTRSRSTSRRSSMVPTTLAASRSALAPWRSIIFEAARLDVRVGDQHDLAPGFPQNDTVSLQQYG